MPLSDTSDLWIAEGVSYKKSYWTAKLITGDLINHLKEWDFTNADNYLLFMKFLIAHNGNLVNALTNILRGTVWRRR